MQTINFTTDADGIATLMIDVPNQSMNVIGPDFLADLDAAITRIASEDAIKGAVIASDKDSGFMAGMDLKYFGSMLVSGESKRPAPADIFDKVFVLNQLFRRLETSGKPVACAIEGTCVGGGFELALACHLRYASSRAKIGLPEVSLGIIPGYGGTQRLQRIVGRGRAFELILTGNHIGAQQAKDIGLVNDLCDPEQLEAMVLKVAETICKRGPLALGNAIDAVVRGGDCSLAEGLAIEADLFGATSATDDMREGMQAFLDKRPPDFQGR